jgi:aconitate hydratase
VTRDPFKALGEFSPAAGRRGRYYSLPALEKAGLGAVSRLPVSLRIVLESLARHCDGGRVTEAHVRALSAWKPNAARTAEIPFFVARVLTQDLTGFLAINDFAAMRAIARRLGVDPARIEPRVPVDLVVDHQVEVDVHGAPDAVRRNLEHEYRRHGERLALLKWAKQAFSGIRVVPPGNGIIHQVNLEYLARGVWEKDGVWFPDTLVATDSHTPMVNGIGVLGWGVGGIEAEAAMLGEPIFLLTPDVVGVHLTGGLRECVTATDLVLTMTERLRKEKVVGAFVEFFGDGAASLSPMDRATVANMAADYGATVGYFPVDDRTVDYFRMTGRDAALVDGLSAYYRAQQMFGMPGPGDIDYSRVVELDLARVVPSVSGPRLPQQRLDLGGIGERFSAAFSAPASEHGYGKAGRDLGQRFPARNGVIDIGHGDVAIAALTSCTNTSNPALMLGAGLLAKKAVERGLRVHPRVKTSLAPGSKVVTAYLREAGLLPYLERLGFGVVAYGCATCMGNSGPLVPGLEEVIARNDVVACAVLSGNRNFEARIHLSLKASFLMSPPLVVAMAIAGTVLIDPTREPLGTGSDGRPVYLTDLWPTGAEIASLLGLASNPGHFRREYGDLLGAKDLWDAIPERAGAFYEWDPASTYILEPPFFEGFGMKPGGLTDITGARALAIFGDALTTEHMSPVSAITASSPAGRWLQERGVPVAGLSTFAARRCNHEVMLRGTFANLRIRNRMAPGKEGGYTAHQPSGEIMTIFDAARRYRSEGVPLVILAGEEYGTGSSRDWAARGPWLMGVRAVVARGFERIHRSNLVGMGIVPCQFQGGDSVQSLGLDGTETYGLAGLSGPLTPGGEVTLVARGKGGERRVRVTLRVDTEIELEYLRHGGILPYVLRSLLEGRTQPPMNADERR